MASVQYDAATRLYPGTTKAAVDELNLSITDGELLVLVGPSGSGKSTALRMLAGLEPLDAGQVLIGGKDVSAVRPRDRDIAMVFQNYALYPQLNVAANMGFALKQRGVRKEERLKRVREVAELSMVDRITPATTNQDRADVAARFGIVDAWPVVCEPFTQWVLEDFASERPPLENAGVQVVDDVAPYELMKLRLLNASHQGLCYFGRLCDYTYVHEAAEDVVFRRFLRGYMDDEATPTLAPVPGVDLDRYKETLLERFANPEIRDTIARLCAEGSDRIPKWLVPVIREQVAREGEIARSAAIVASWARYAEGVDEHGVPIEIVDRRREEIMALAGASNPLAFIENRDLFGGLAESERFKDAYQETLRSLHEHGAAATLAAFANDTG